MSADWWQQQELEQERLCNLLAILNRVASGNTTEQDAVELAAELGITQYYSTRQETT